ncbi:MAG: hypothetical protein AAF447_07065 [Myxococcota bacterium]
MSGGTLALVAAACLVGCTLVNDVDVCERATPEVVPLQSASESPRFAPSTQALAPLGETQRVAASIRQTLAGGELVTTLLFSALDADGARAPICTGTALTLEGVEVFSTSSDFSEVITGGAIAAPNASGGVRTGLSVATVLAVDDPSTLLGPRNPNEALPEGDSFLFGTGFDPSSGCPLTNTSGTRVDSFLLNAGGGAITFAPSIAHLGPAEVMGVENGDRFAVVWAESTEGGGIGVAFVTVYGRIVEINRLLGPQLGPQVTLTSGLVQRPFVLATGPNELVLAYYRANVEDGGVSLEVIFDPLDGALAPRGDRRFVLDSFSATESVSPAVALGWDGEQVLASWVRSVGGRSQVVAAFRSAEGLPLRAADDPSGAPFAVESIDAGRQLEPALAGLEGGGFLLAWTEQNAAGAGNARRRLRALAFAPDGRRFFTNPACGNNAFTLDQGESASSATPSLVPFQGGALALWTSADRSGSGRFNVGTRLWTGRALLPGN